MTEVKSWKEFIESNELLHYEENQAQFYNRTKNFIQGNESKVLINQGGMGLGKTLATIKAMNLKINNYVATPFSQIKNEWSKELNFALLSHGVWHSKSDCCIRKRDDIKFNMSNCNDGCKYRKHLEQNKEFTQECEILTKNIKFPLIIGNHYDTYGCKNCLLPITRNRLRKEKIIVGDFFGIFLPKMFNYVTKKNQYETDLHIDEGHMLPERAKQYLSRQLSIGIMIKKMTKALDEDNYFLFEMDRRIIIENFLREFQVIKESLIEQIKNEKDKISRIDYNGFLNLWKKCCKLEFNGFLNELKIYTTQEKNNDAEDEIKIFKEVLAFFTYWKDKNSDKDYNGLFQYFSSNDGEIMLKINCSATGKFLNEMLSKFNKVHILSGTIPDKEYFKKMIGIEDCIFENPLDSYSIKDNVINFGVGNFNSKFREATYNNNLEFLKKILKKFKGRTLIYTQSKEYCTKLYYLLQGLNTFNLNQKNNNELTKVKEKFNNSLNGIAIGYITGKVEGQNFMDDDGNAVENVIIYGYPYMKLGIEKDDAVKYWTKKLNGDYTRAKEYVEFLPISSTIYQAAMRAKRNEKDNPVIILWSKEFSPGHPGYKYAYSELKGDVIYDEEKVFNKIELIQNGNNC